MRSAKDRNGRLSPEKTLELWQAYKSSGDARLRDLATNPKRYQVSFLSGEPDPDAVARLAESGVEGEQLAVIGRELYAWHPDGIARSKLWAALAGGRLGVIATARNWTTVETLAEMAQS